MARAATGSSTEEECRTKVGWSHSDVAARPTRGDWVLSAPIGSGRDAMSDLGEAQRTMQSMEQAGEIRSLLRPGAPEGSSAQPCEDALRRWRDEHLGRDGCRVGQGELR